jgi:hypothetical protein
MWAAIKSANFKDASCKKQTELRHQVGNALKSCIFAPDCLARTKLTSLAFKKLEYSYENFQMLLDCFNWHRRMFGLSLRSDDHDKQLAW